jgi:hypothetical protein
LLAAMNWPKKQILAISISKSILNYLENLPQNILFYGKIDQSNIEVVRILDERMDYKNERLISLEPIK